MFLFQHLPPQSRSCHPLPFLSQSCLFYLKTTSPVSTWFSLLQYYVLFLKPTSSPSYLLRTPQHPNMNHHPRPLPQSFSQNLITQSPHPKPRKHLPQPLLEYIRRSKLLRDDANRRLPVTVRDSGSVDGVSGYVRGKRTKIGAGAYEGRNEGRIIDAVAGYNGVEARCGGGLWGILRFDSCGRRLNIDGCASFEQAGEGSNARGFPIEF